MKGHISIVIFVCICLCTRAFSQNAVQGKEEVKQSGAILNNLDTLMTLWYVKNATPVKNRNSQNIYKYKPDEVPVFSDSVYAHRLRMIPSPLPFAYNETVRAFIDLYANRKRDQVEKMLGLSEIYFPIFEEVLDRNKMPLELKYLSVVESALNTRAESRVHATGLWQFMYTTANLYNLDINSFVDQRKDPVKATEAAALLLKDLHGIFGDWFLAIAAYNCGPGNVNKAIRRSGGKRTFWEIYPYLPAETRGYVPAFIAAAYVFHYHREHNLYPQEVTLPKFVDTVLINKEITFQPIARVLDISVDELRDLNPEYTRDIIPARGMTYTLRLPAAKASAYTMYKDSIYHTYTAMLIAANPKYNPNDSSGIAQVTFKGGKGPENYGPKAIVKYTVKSGDNLPFIADLFDVSVYSLKRWNHIGRHKIGVGKKLTIDVPADKSAYYRKINTMTMLQKKKEIYGRLHEAPEVKVAVKDDKIEKPDSTATASATPVPVKEEKKTASKRDKKVAVKQPVEKVDEADKDKTDEVAVETRHNIKYYTVQKVDTLWSIAQRFPGVTVDAIKKANGLRGNQKIQPGQKIRILKS